MTAPLLWWSTRASEGDRAFKNKCERGTRYLGGPDPVLPDQCTPPYSRHLWVNQLSQAQVSCGRACSKFEFVVCMCRTRFAPTTSRQPVPGKRINLFLKLFSGGRQFFHVLQATGASLMYQKANLNLNLVCCMMKSVTLVSKNSLIPLWRTRACLRRYNLLVLSTSWMRFMYTGTVCFWGIEIQCRRLLLRGDLWVEVVVISWQTSNKKNKQPQPKKTEKQRKVQQNSYTTKKEHKKQSKVDQTKNKFNKTQHIDRNAYDNFTGQKKCFLLTFFPQPKVKKKAQAARAQATKEANTTSLISLLFHQSIGRASISLWRFSPTTNDQNTLK